MVDNEKVLDEDLDEENDSLDNLFFDLKESIKSLLDDSGLNIYESIGVLEETKFELLNFDSIDEDILEDEEE